MSTMSGKKVAEEDGDAVGPPSARTRVRRMPQRGIYDRDTVCAVLDAGLVCQVAVVMNGSPLIIPTGYVRFGDYVYLHGKSNSALMGHLAAGNETCFSVTLLDGLVLARSAFHHSVNYRSIVMFARGEEVTEEADKMEALKWFVDGFIPGRWDYAVQPTPAEMKATTVIRLPINEASVKMRSGGPKDDADDMNKPIWAGVIPTAMVSYPAEPSSDLIPGVPPPAHVTNFHRIPPAAATSGAKSDTVEQLSAKLDAMRQELLDAVQARQQPRLKPYLVLLLFAIVVFLFSIRNNTAM